jgi:hypothetical protein
MIDGVLRAFAAGDANAAQAIIDSEPAAVPA